jgi:hypothetical protein
MQGSSFYINIGYLEIILLAFSSCLFLYASLLLYIYICIHGYTCIRKQIGSIVVSVPIVRREFGGGGFEIFAFYL